MIFLILKTKVRFSLVIENKKLSMFFLTKILKQKKKNNVYKKTINDERFANYDCTLRLFS